MPIQRRRARRLSSATRSARQRRDSERSLVGQCSLYMGLTWEGRVEAMLRDARSLCHGNDPEMVILLVSDRADDPVWRRALGRVGAATTCRLRDVASALAAVSRGRRRSHGLVMFDCAAGRGIRDFADAAPLIRSAFYHRRTTILCSAPADDELRPVDAELFGRCVLVDDRGRRVAEIWDDDDDS